MSLDISTGKLITFNDGKKIKCGVELIEENKKKNFWVTKSICSTGKIDYSIIEVFNIDDIKYIRNYEDLEKSEINSVYKDWMKMFLDFKSKSS